MKDIGIALFCLLLLELQEDERMRCIANLDENDQGDLLAFLLEFSNKQFIDLIIDDIVNS